MSAAELTFRSSAAAPWAATARALLEEAWADRSERLANEIVAETISATGWARQSAFYGARDVLCDRLRPYREAGVGRVAAAIAAEYQLAIANGADQASAFRRAKLAGHEAAQQEFSEANVKGLKTIRSAAAAAAMLMARCEQHRFADDRDGASLRAVAGLLPSKAPRRVAPRRTSSRSTSRRRVVRRGSSVRPRDAEPEPPLQLDAALEAEAERA